MAVYTDQTQRKIEIAQAPQRIISTVPSQTELLAYLGLERQVVGITAYCVHPKDWLQKKTVIGGTKDLQIEKIRQLQPDLIIGNKEENIKEQIETLAKDVPVWLSDITSVDDALAMLQAVGEVCHRPEPAQKLVGQINDLRALAKTELAVPSLYFIWKEPYMVAGADTFISAMMQECGLENKAPQNEQRYPTMSLQEICQSSAQQIILSSEPYAFTTADAHFLSRETGKKVKIVDGELFSWYGSRMAKAFPYFQRLHQELAFMHGAFKC